MMDSSYNSVTSTRDEENLIRWDVFVGCAMRNVGGRVCNVETMPVPACDAVRISRAGGYHR